MKILLVEDIEYKRDKVIGLLESISADVSVDVAKSYVSAVNSATSKTYDLIILDMSLPTYDKGPNENGGRFRVYGGKDIIRKLMRGKEHPDKEMKILLVEDIEYKRDKVIGLLESISADVSVDVAKSYVSAVNSATSKTYDLIILDMSLPTYDKGPNENGGRFRVYGGKDIIRKLMRGKEHPVVVVLTQHTTFGEIGEQKNTDTLSQELNALMGSKFIGIVKYDSTKPQWKDEIKKVVQDLL